MVPSEVMLYPLSILPCWLFRWQCFRRSYIPTVLSLTDLLVTPFPQVFQNRYLVESVGTWHLCSINDSPFMLLVFCCCCSVTQSCLTLRPHGLQHARLPWPSLSPGVCSNSCPLSQWCHPTISSLAAPFFCLSFSPASQSFPVIHLFTSGGQSIGASASASVLPMNIQGEFPLGLTGFLIWATPM